MKISIINLLEIIENSCKIFKKNCMLTIYFLVWTEDFNTFIKPSVQVAYIGDSAIIDCNVDNAHWQKDWARVPPGVIRTMTGISIPTIGPEHDGVYACTDTTTGRLLTSMLRVGGKSVIHGTIKTMYVKGKIDHRHNTLAIFYFF